MPIPPPRPQPPQQLPMPPAVSVILPVRDGGDWLHEAVASVLAQGFGDFELLVIDDGSTDGAPAGLPHDPRLRVLANPGRGLVAALNHGMHCARGAFLARMDADDRCHPQRLERQLALLHARPDIGLCGVQVELLQPDGGPPPPGGIAYRDWLNALTEPAAIAREIFIESPLPHPGWLLRRAVWTRVGPYRDGPWPEDYDWLLRAHRAGVRMAKPADGVLLDWREHPQRLTRRDPRCARANLIAVKAPTLAAVLAGRELLLWGATKTGGRLHDALAAAGVRVRAFVDLDPRRRAGCKRGLPVLAPADAAAHADAAILVTVSQGAKKPVIRAQLAALGRTEGEDWWFAT